MHPPSPTPQSGRGHSIFDVVVPADKVFIRIHYVGRGHPQAPRSGLFSPRSQAVNRGPHAVMMVSMKPMPFALQGPQAQSIVDIGFGTQSKTHCLPPSGDKQMLQVKNIKYSNLPQEQGVQARDTANGSPKLGMPLAVSVEKRTQVLYSFPQKTELMPIFVGHLRTNILCVLRESAKRGGEPKGIPNFTKYTRHRPNNLYHYIFIYILYIYFSRKNNYRARRGQRHSFFHCVQCSAVPVRQHVRSHHLFQEKQRLVVPNLLRVLKYIYLLFLLCDNLTTNDASNLFRSATPGQYIA